MNITEYPVQVVEVAHAIGPRGPKGEDGADSTVPGPRGETGSRGPEGLTAYEVAVEAGFVGTVAEWLYSLSGEDRVAAEAAADRAEAAAEAAVAPTAEVVNAVLTDPGSAASQTVTGQVSDQVPPLVADAIAADPTVADAAAAAVAGAVADADLVTGADPRVPQWATLAGRLMVLLDAARRETWLGVNDVDGGPTPWALEHLQRSLGVGVQQVPGYLLALADSERRMTDLAIRSSDGQLADFVVDRLRPRILAGYEPPVPPIPPAPPTPRSYADTRWVEGTETYPIRADSTRACGFGSSSMQGMDSRMATLFAGHGVAYYSGGKASEASQHIAARLGSIPAVLTVTGAWRSIETRRNLASDPRATRIGSITAAGWAAQWYGAGGVGQTTLVTGATDGPEVAPGIRIPTYLRKTWTTAPATMEDTGFDHTATTPTSVSGNAGLPVTPGQVITVSSYVRPGATATEKRSYIGAVFRDAAGVTTGTTATSSAVAPAPGVWTRQSLTFTVPAGAATVNLATRTTNLAASLWAVGDTFDGTGLLVEVSPVLRPYMDGTLSPDPDLTPSWTGTANASASVLTGASSVPVTTPTMPTNNALRPYTGTLAGVPGTLAYDVALAGFLFTRAAPGLAVAVPAGTAFIPDAASHRDAIVVLWMGKNNLGSTGTDTLVISQTDTTVDWLVPLAKRVLVLGHFVDGNTPVGSLEYSQIAAVNDAHRKRYGRLFVDVSAYLTGSQVWADTGITPTAEDLAKQAQGIKPPSLSENDGHLNAVGYDAVVAHLITPRLAELGWDLGA